MLTRGDQGAAVISLQKQLIALDYPLPRWGADGDLGNETLGAVARFLVDHGDGYLDADPDTVSDPELARVQQVYDAAAWPVPVPGVTFYDLRRDSDPKNIHGRRAWTAITGITLHQTACDFGHERASRWNTLWAHVGASREGNVYWVHDFEHLVWHGNGFNGATVGLECEGNYAGITGDRSTAWQPRAGELMVPTSALVKAAQDAIRWIFATVARHGGHLRNLYAHRQAAASRRADPGEELWQAVALPMLAELGLEDGGTGYKLGEGRPIPAAWDERHVGSAY